MKEVSAESFATKKQILIIFEDKFNKQPKNVDYIKVLDDFF